MSATMKALWFQMSPPTTWMTNPLDMIPSASESHLAAIIGAICTAIVLVVLYAQCCLQPKKRPPPQPANIEGSMSPASSIARPASRESTFSDFSPSPSLRKGESPYNSFQDLMELTKPAFKHIGASLPVGTLQKAVNKLNDRLQYRMVTSKTHVGGGLSSIFVNDGEHPPLAKSPSLAGGLGALEAAFAEDFLYGSDSDESVQDIQMITLTEQSFRRSEIFSSLPEAIVKLLVKRCQLRSLEEGDVLFQAGEKKTPSASTFVVVSGEMSMVVPAEFFVPAYAASSAAGASLVFGQDEEDETGPLMGEDQQTLTISQGRTVSGISDFIATIVGEPVEYVVTAIAKTSCVVAEITYAQLEHLFDSHEGVREDLLQRALALLQRVTFSSVYRLTGRFATSFAASKNSVPPAPPAGAADSSGSEIDWATIASVELGVSPSDLTTFAKERRKKTTLRRVRTGSFFKPPEDLLFLGATESNNGDLIVNTTPTSWTEAVFPAILTLHDKETLKNDDVALYIVLSGCLEVRTLNFAGDKKGTLQYKAYTGQAVGHLGVLTRTFAEWYYPRDQDGDDAFPCNLVTAVGDVTKVLRISERDYFDLVERYPDIVITRAKHILTRLAPLVRLIDVATNFVLALPGDAVIKEGESVDGLMVILHGRVRFYQGDIGGREFARGAILGENSFLTNQPSQYSVVAMRRTSLASVPKMVVKAVTAKYPHSLAHISRIISRKMLQSPWDAADSTRTTAGDKNADFTKKRRAVAVVPISPNVPFESFIYALSAALNAQSIKCAVLSSGVSNRSPEKSSNYVEFYGSHSVDSPSATTLDEIEILSRMQDAEEANDVVLFQLDQWSLNEDASKWSKLCVAQADAVLLVANASDRPMTSPLERRLRQVVSSARRELVMLHVMSESDSPTFLPKNTREWIEELGGVVSSHHIRFHPYDTRLDTFHWKSDLRKLGRWITGNAIGLVLGGGGARGCAHMSVLKALEANQIPVDFIGGTSIGAFVGGLYCMKGGDMAEVQRVFDMFAENMSSIWIKLRDVTFPIVAYLKGYQFNRGIVRVFGDTNIEDFWTNFFCVSTDLTDSREIAHRNGFAWKYIRASMTLTGYLPPICDVQMVNGTPSVHYLVDGGYIDNMPVDEMRKIVGKSGTVIAVDVQSAWKLTGEDYGEDLNGWWYLWRWLSPFHKTPAIPTASEIQSHLAFISCVQRFGRSMSEIPVDLYVSPPLGTTLTMDFQLARKIQEITYEPVMEKIKSWLRDPKIKRKAFFAQSVALASAASSEGTQPEDSGLKEAGLVAQLPQIEIKMKAINDGSGVAGNVQEPIQTIS